MLSDTKIIALYCIVDDLLKAMGHHDDSRSRVADSEVITTAFVSVLFFGGHLQNASDFMRIKGFVPAMLSKSRYCRRLHRVADLVVSLFYGLGTRLKAVCGAESYQLDSFPVAFCDNMRISNRRLLRQKDFVGRTASMHRYFCGVRVQVLTLKGCPVEFCLVPARENDIKALYKLPLDVPPESCIYVDAGYTDYKAEEDLFYSDAVWLKTVRKSNSKRPDSPSEAYIKNRMRKQIETQISLIKSKMLRCTHAVTEKGFLLKVALFVIAFAFDKFTN